MYILFLKKGTIRLVSSNFLKGHLNVTPCDTANKDKKKGGGWENLSYIYSTIETNKSDMKWLLRVGSAFTRVGILTKKPVTVYPTRTASLFQ
jgi:hypothetical protein